MDAIFVYLFGNVDSADVGISFFCLFSIMCKLKLFTTTSAFTSGESHDTFSASNVVFATKTGKKDSLASGMNLSRKVGNFGSDTSSQWVIFFRFITVRFCKFIKRLYLVLLGKWWRYIYVEYGLLTRLLTLPLNLQILIGTNCLSLISNCLTYSMRPSQVFYAFLLYTSDMVLYGIGSEMGVALAPSWRASRRGSAVKGAASPEAPLAVTVFETESEFSPLGSYPADDVLSNVWREGVTDAFSETAGRNLIRIGGAARCENQLSPVLDTRMSEIDWGHSGCSCSIMSVNDYYGSSKHDSPYRRQPSAVGRSVFSLVLLNMLFVSILMVFHRNNLFFCIGTLAGYLTSCGTLFILGYDIGMLFFLFEELHAGVSALSFLTGVSTNTSTVSDTTPLPPMNVLVDWKLRMWYVMEHVFLFFCSLFYFGMVLERGEELYASHVEFMRWYANTIGEGLQRLVRLLVLYFLLLLGRRSDWKLRYIRVYGVGGGGVL